MQQRCLVRARGLAAFRRVLVERAVAGGPAAARRRQVVVPTRASAELLRQTIEQQLMADGVGAVVLPDFVTREDWLQRLHLLLPGPPALLSRLDREVLLDHAARATLASRPRLTRPFHLRPGLVAAMLDFYDELRRRQRSIRRFARGIFDDLRVERGTDRGSESLIGQTAFLGLTFLAYERAVKASGALDEHALRDALLETQPRLACDDLVIAVADHPADPSGLWPADFDLVGRLRHLPQVVVVMTDEAHDAGFRDRLERELPGIVEARAPDVPGTPILLVPESGPDQTDPVFVSRDREEELRDVARTIRARAEAGDGAVTRPTAVVFHRPLPYLYLAQQVLEDAQVPYQAFDALPLAAEPYAALLDLTMAVGRTGGTREASLALLRSSLLRFEVDGQVVVGADASALEAVLLDRRSSCDAQGYVSEVEAFFGGRASRGGVTAARAARAAVAARDAAAELAPYLTAPQGSGQVRTLSAFLRAHERRVASTEAWGDRHRRARVAVLAVLDALAEAFASHDDRPRSHDDLAALVHHAVEARTFMPRRGSAGVHLVDAVAARFGAFDDVYVVGLVESDWSTRQRRSVFYSTGLLKTLGWPQDTDMAAAEQAAFRDVLVLARAHTRLSAFEMDGDAVVARSPLMELARGLTVEPVSRPERGRLFADETLTAGLVPTGLTDGTAAWLDARHRRPPVALPPYAGQIAPRAPGLYRVSQVDTYVTCPFKYYAQFVLHLGEERDEVSGLTPIERGMLLHRLFEQFYLAWQAQGQGAITRDTLAEACALFDTLADAELARLPEADRVLERLRLLGSLIERGVAERVFELEVEDGRAVRERLIEEPLEGAFTFPGEGSGRTIAIKGKADRIDVLHDGSLRVVDYKLGRMPDMKTSIQVAVYAHCASQVLERREGRRHPVADALYVAFGDPALVGRLPGKREAVPLAVEARAAEFARVVDRIERGAFPPAPRSVRECSYCGFAGVCRKEYRQEPDDDADAV